MIRILLTIFGIVICYLLQTSVPAIELAHVVPDMLIVLVITAGYTRGKTAGLFTGLCSGLMIDLCIGDYVGLYGILYMLIGYLAGYSYKIYDKDDYTLPILFIGIGEFLYQNMYFIIEFALRGKFNYGFYLEKIMIPRTVYTIAVGVFLYKLFHSVHRLLLRLEHKED